MIITLNKLPWKLTLNHKLTKKSYVYYASTTDYLQYDTDAFTSKEEHKETPRTSRKVFKVVDNLKLL